jgi:predicted transcriptional regulator
VSEVKDRVLATLRELGRPARPGEIAQAAGLTKDEVSKAIKELKKEGKITSPKRCFYAPAE